LQRLRSEEPDCEPWLSLLSFLSGERGRSATRTRGTLSLRSWRRAQPLAKVDDLAGRLVAHAAERKRLGDRLERAYVGRPPGPGARVAAARS
jgi:hypothetical protein